MAPSGTPARLFNLHAKNLITGNISSLFFGIESSGLSHFTYSTSVNLSFKLSTALLVIWVLLLPPKTSTGVLHFPLPPLEEGGNFPPTLTTPPNSTSELAAACKAAIPPCP